MAVAYPEGLRPAIRAGKARSQPAAFRFDQPRRGMGYAQAAGPGAPRSFTATFRFTQAEAAAFLWWFANDLERGTLEAEIPVRTEAGVETLTCRFAPGGLLDCTEIGEVWNYTATLIDVGYVAPPVDWPDLPVGDLPAYPLGLRTIIRASKLRQQPAAFTMTDPRAGFPYAQTSGFDTPAVWSVEFRFDATDAATFQAWFRDDVQLGVVPFTMPIKTEAGVSDYTCQFLPDGLLDCREDGEVWTYSAQIVARTLVVSDPRNIEIYSIPGTYEWLPPDGATRYEIRALGAGGGGGGGSHTGASTNPSGGGGGGGGGYIAVATTSITGPITITVGAGGIGGTGAPSSLATAGVAGGTSSFGSLAIAYGGGGGGAGGNNSAVGGGGGGAGTTAVGGAGPTRSVSPGLGGTGGAVGGGNGGRSGLDGTTVTAEGTGAGGGGGALQGTTGGSSVRGGAGGGGGSGSGSSNNATGPFSGGFGGGTLLVPDLTAGGVKNVIGDDGVDPADLAECSAGSAGGGGGGSGSNIAGFNTGLAGDGGAAGRGSGGGGGGGVYASNSAHTGDGGVGGDGIVVVITYF